MYLNEMIKKTTDKKKSALTISFILILLLPHFKPLAFTTDGSIIDIVYNVGKLLSALFIIIYYLRYCIKNKYISKPYLIYFILQTYSIIITTIQTGFNKSYIVSYVSYVILLMIIDCFAHKNPKELLYALLIIFEVLILANFILMIIYPEGLPLPDHGFCIHFLGNRNDLIVYFILSLTFALLLRDYGINKIHFYLLLAVSLISLIIGKGTTSFFVICLYMLFYFTKFFKTKYFNLTGSILTMLVLFLLVVIFRIQNFMAPVWELFGKNVTFSSRTMIWDNVLNHVKEIPIYGFGKLTPELRMQLIGNERVAHNFILDNLTEGGIIQLIIIALFLVSVIFILKKNRTDISARYLLLGIIPLMLRTLVEPCLGPLDYMLFIILGHISEIIESKKNYNKLQPQTE